MKLATLLHNPKAGEKAIDGKELTEIIHSEGWDCRYSSTKDKEWEEIRPGTEIIIVAGGDGTVKKAAQHLLQRKIMDGNIPIALLPMGTANNIARTLGISGEKTEIIRSWKQKKLQSFDIGKIEGIKDCPFFLEALGFGVFPRLIKHMNNLTPEEKKGSPEEEIQLALEVLYEIILSYEAKQCEFTIDDARYSGKCLMLEVMNTKSIGPNLILSPEGRVDDGYLELVWITEDKRNLLADYIQSFIKDKNSPFPFETLKGKDIHVQWHSPHLHVDDNSIKTESPATVNIHLQESVLNFLIA